MREDQIPNAGMLDEVASANNFDPLLVDWYADVLVAAAEDPGVLRVMGVTHVATDRAWPRGEHVIAARLADLHRLPDATGRAWVVQEARDFARQSTLAEMRSPSFDATEVVLVEGRPLKQEESGDRLPGSSELALRDGPNRVTIRAVLDAPGYLVLADTWYPGWHARVDDEPAPLLRANHAFRAVQLTAGEHIVDLVYRPTSVLVGAASSVATLGLMLLGVIAGPRRRP
jgi:hypothetical protein